MSKLYYTAPADKQFEELKRAAIKIWETYDNTYGYVNEKVGQIKSMKNIRDNFMYIVAMFDQVNQAKLAKAVSKPTRTAVAIRISDGGQPFFLNPFLI